MAQDPYAKTVGDIGEQIVDDYYTKNLGFQRESSPDYRVDRKYSTPKTKNTVYVEIIARRISTLQIVPAFYIDKDKVERLKNFQEDYGTVTLAIVINPDERRKFKVGLTSLDNLLKSVVIDNIAFPITAERKVNAGEPPKTVVYFPIEKLTFTHRSVDPALESKLNKAFDEMDAARAGKANPTDGTLFAETPIDEIIETNPEIIRITTYRYSQYPFLNTPLSKKCVLKFNQNDSGEWVISAGSIASVISNQKTSFHFGGDSGIAKAVHEICQTVFNTGSENSTRVKIYLKVEDVHRVLRKATGLFKKDFLKTRAEQFLQFWQSIVMPHIQNGTLKQILNIPDVVHAPLSKPQAPPIEQPPKPKATIIQQILSRATQFKGYGLNGTSLVTAIKFVTDEEKIDPQPYLDFMNFAQAEVTHTETTNTK